MRAGCLFLALFLLVSPAAAQQQTFQYQNIVLAAPTTTTVKSTAGVLHSICINTNAAGTATIYDNTVGSGTKIGTITGGVVGIGPICQIYDVAFWTGLTIVTATPAMDITVSFR
jgi:uncharacterized protein YcfJ